MGVAHNRGTPTCPIRTFPSYWPMSSNPRLQANQWGLCVWGAMYLDVLQNTTSMIIDLRSFVVLSGAINWMSNLPSAPSNLVPRLSLRLYHPDTPYHPFPVTLNPKPTHTRSHHTCSQFTHSPILTHSLVILGEV